MRRSLLLALVVTDLSFLLYWAVSGMGELGWIEMPRSLMGLAPARAEGVAT